MRRIILSRKGADSAAGGLASPILPADEDAGAPAKCLSIPIPSRDRVRLGDIESLRPVVTALRDRAGRPLLKAQRPCHLDPDLDPVARPRSIGWRPTFGQVGPAATHLAKQGVSVGDLFLFLGWFRPTTWQGPHLVFTGPPGGIHAFFGWLQVGEILRNPQAEEIEARPWIASHPHASGGWHSSNTMYIAADELSVPGVPRGLPGGGVFQAHLPAHVLTSAGAGGRSEWLLPKFFMEAGLSYHRNPARWASAEGGGAAVGLRTVGRGQEFVADVGAHGAAVAEWLQGLFAGGQ